ncbi:MAG: hypothetical protein JW729_11250 [Bacteroidales bacterium]|nr:hypothetical protein [Bacteroidales bacterium]
MRKEYQVKWLSIFWVFLISVIGTQGLSQDSNKEAKKTEYVTWVIKKESKTCGYVKEINFHYLTITDLTYGKNNPIIHFESIDIEHINVRKKGYVRRGLFFGGLSGALLGDSLEQKKVRFQFEINNKKNKSQIQKILRFFANQSETTTMNI